jgi:hypothetical protein
MSRVMLHVAGSMAEMLPTHAHPHAHARTHAPTRRARACDRIALICATSELIRWYTLSTTVTLAVLTFGATSSFGSEQRNWRS